MKRAKTSPSARRKQKCAPSTTAATRPVRRRLPPAERKLLIIEAAIAYFAEVGFEGQTRNLSKRLGVTNALLFRYFPTKEELVERVYQQVYVGRWAIEWEEALKDRSVPLEQRLRRFYKSYLSVIYTYEWIRIFFFAGLRRVNINERYLSLLNSRIVQPICVEVRHEYGLPSPEKVPIAPMESDAVWGLQGQILYIGVRRFIYNQVIVDPQRSVDTAVDVFLSGIGRVAIAASAPPRKLTVVEHH